MIVMGDTLLQIRDRIRALRSELGELETAERVIMALPTGEQHEPKTVLATRNDLSDATIYDAAQKILAESSEPMHFEEITKRAAARGYSSGRKGGIRPQSFWAIMNRNRDVFKAEGEGKYSLRKPI